MPGRNDGDGPCIKNGVVEVFGVIGAVGDDVAGSEALDQVFAKDDVASIARGDHKAYRQAERINGGMDLGA